MIKDTQDLLKCRYNMTCFTILKSVLFFYITLLYNGLRYGWFTYAQIVGDTTTIERKNGVALEYSKDGSLIAINDGKKTPLLLGSIPLSQKDIDSCREKYGLLPGAKIALYTLNRHFECVWSGLRRVIDNNKATIIHYRYPTTDYVVPSFIDLIRLVRDLDNRDQYSLAYLHCKAGRGRSAMGAAAYIAYLLQKAGELVGPEQDSEKIIAYLARKRPQVDFNAQHKKALRQFIQALQSAGGFVQLLHNYQDVVAARDQAVTLASI